jgi:hypothetical protein
VQRNPFMAINCGFARTPEPERRPDDYVILAEDDFVVANDVLEWHVWASRELYADDRVLLVSSNQYEEQPGGFAQATLVRWFPGWVWGIWRDRWENLVAPDWTFDYEYDGWDWRITRYWCEHHGMMCAAPAVSRSQHIGEFGGAHTIPGDSFRSQQSRCFQPDIPVQEYRRPDGIVEAGSPRM